MGKIDLPGKEDIAAIAGAIGKQTDILSQYFAKVQTDFSAVQTWKGFKDICTAGAARRYFAIGDQFQCKKGTTTITWDLVHIGNNEDGSNYVVLYAHDLLSVISFCERQAAFYATSAIPAGTYHFNPSLTGMSGQWANDEWKKTMQFTTTVEIPKGGQIALSGAIDWNNYYKPWTSGIKIATYSGPTSSTALETITPTEGSDGTDLATLGEINCSQRMSWGSNNWKESDMRQYLNADGAVSSWWTAQTPFSRIPGAAAKIGFMNDIDADFLDVISKVKLKTDRNTVTEGGGQDTTVDKFFLPARANLNCGNADESAPESSVIFDYYTKFRQDGKTGTNTGTDANKLKSGGNWYFLRSPNRGGAYGVALVHDGGALGGDNASSTDGLAPACTINYHI